MGKLCGKDSHGGASQDVEVLARPTRTSLAEVLPGTGKHSRLRSRDPGGFGTNGESETVRRGKEWKEMNLDRQPRPHLTGAPNNLSYPC